MLLIAAVSILAFMVLKCNAIVFPALAAFALGSEILRSIIRPYVSTDRFFY